MGETNPKAILVRAGGSIDIHGEAKRTWTKLDGTVPADQDNPAILWDHSVRDMWHVDGHAWQTYLVLDYVCYVTCTVQVSVFK